MAPVEPKATAGSSTSPEDYDSRKNPSFSKGRQQPTFSHCHIHDVHHQIKRVHTEFPLWFSRLRTWLASRRFRFNPWPHSWVRDPVFQWLWCRPAAAALIIPSLTTSICRRCGLKKKKEYVYGLADTLFPLARHVFLLLLGRQM